MDERRASVVDPKRNALWVYQLDNRSEPRQLPVTNDSSGSFAPDGSFWFTSDGAVRRLSASGELMPVPAVDGPAAGITLVRVARDGVRVAVVADGRALMGVIERSTEGAARSSRCGRWWAACAGSATSAGGSPPTSTSWDPCPGRAASSCGSGWAPALRRDCAPRPGPPTSRPRAGGDHAGGGRRPDHPSRTWACSGGSRGRASPWPTRADSDDPVDAEQGCAHDTESGGPTLGQLAAALLDLVVPQECAGCGHAGVVWCSAVPGRHDRHAPRIAVGVPGAAAAEHAGPLGRAVVAYKDAGQRRPRRSAGVGLGRRGARRADRHRDSLTASRARALRPSGWCRCPAGRRPAVGAAPTTWPCWPPGPPASCGARAGSRTGAACSPTSPPAATRWAGPGGAPGQPGRHAGAPSRRRPGSWSWCDDVTTTGATLEEATRALRIASRGGTAGPGWASPGRSWPRRSPWRRGSGDMRRARGALALVLRSRSPGPPWCAGLEAEANVDIVVRGRHSRCRSGFVTTYRQGAEGRPVRADHRHVDVEVSYEPNPGSPTAPSRSS